jgi:hypothetical protein
LDFGRVANTRHNAASPNLGRSNLCSGLSLCRILLKQHFCHHERASAREGSAFPTFSAIGETTSVKSSALKLVQPLTNKNK